MSKYPEMAYYSNPARPKQMEEAVKFDRYFAYPEATIEGWKRDLCTHELGHTTADQLFGQINSSLIQDRFKVQVEAGRYYSGEIHYRMKPNAEADLFNSRCSALFDKYKNSDLRYKWSVYSQHDRYEFFAETFVLYNRQMEVLPEDIIQFFNDLKIYANKGALH
jgi:hypothetical protein